MATHKDVVCGMMVHDDSTLTEIHAGKRYYFCSEYCRQAFLAQPDRYAAGVTLQCISGDVGTRRIAYFSMEVAADSRMPTYSGGLGVLAGDTLKSCADLRLPVVGVSLLYKHGYFEQHLDGAGNQQERAVEWKPSDFARLLPATVAVLIEGRTVTIRAWEYDIVGVNGFCVPLLLLDSDADQNSPCDRELTGWLYGGDQRYRLAQEVILGVGGLRMLRALGFNDIERFHMNEGHSALLVLELLRERHAGNGKWDFEGVRERCVFTTHTPVAAGHDHFADDLVGSVLGEIVPLEVTRMLGGHDGLNMTLLALNASSYVNGVAKRHGEVSREMFADYSIDSITNGVHSRTWTCDSFKRLYDRHIPGWVNDPFALRYAVGIPKTKLWEAHTQAKRQLIGELSRRGISLNTEDFTIGFARRATPYKRADLILSDPGQLLETARSVGPIQIIYAGKAHPRDEAGKEVIRKIVRASGASESPLRIAYVENYDVALAQLMVAGADLWLNTPLRPLEASGTSGMKAAHNGVPSFSVLDGWWMEGHIEGVTGWSIGPALGSGSSPEADRQDAEDLYRKLRAVIAPIFYNDRERWTDIMRQTIAFNASFFNTHRMVQQYAANAYL